MSFFKIAHLLLVLCISVSVSIFGQENYIKTVVPGNKWEIKMEFGSNFPALDSEILITCDTAHLNGYIYQEVQVIDDSSLECGPGGYVREDTIGQRVYFISRSEEAELNEILIADFSLEIGDTFEFDNGWRKQVVQDVRYINYHGLSQVKYIDFGLQGIEGLVEGHGRLTTGIIDRCRTVGLPRLNGLEITDLNCNTITSNNTIQAEETIRVLPNPARDYVKIEFEDGVTTSIVKYELISAIGSVLKKGRLNTDNEIDLNDLPIGILYLLLQVEGKQLVKKIIHH